MSSCTEIRAEATALMAMPPDDPGRQEARAHAASCPGCAAALRQAQAVIAALDQLPAPPPATADTLARSRAAILLRMEGEAEPLAGWRRAVVPAQILALFAATVLHRQGAFPAALWLQGAVLAVAAAVLSVLAVSRGPLAAALAAGVAALAGALLGSSGELHLQHGISCAVSELIVAAIPLATTVLLLGGRERWASALPAAAAAGALGGLAGRVLLCPYRSWDHLLVFHVGAVLLALAAGAVLARAVAIRR